jgi:hypothetical protein
MSQRPTRHEFFPEANNEVLTVLSECDSRKALNSGPDTRSHYLLVINICPVINAQPVAHFRTSRTCSTGSPFGASRHHTDTRKRCG